MVIGKTLDRRLGHHWRRTLRECVKKTDGCGSMSNRVLKLRWDFTRQIFGLKNGKVLLSFEDFVVGVYQNLLWHQEGTGLI